MKCRYCGQTIPDGVLRCENCGREVQMVPDYNPLDDMLTAHVKDSIYHTGNTGRDTGRTTGRGTSSRAAGRTGQTGRTSRTARTGQTGQTGRSGRTGRGAGTVGTRRDQEMRRRQAKKRKELKRKKRRRLLLVMFLILAAIIGICIALYLNSYPGTVGSANRALESGDYTKAEEYFRKAISKNDKKADAYTGLSKVYIAKDDLDTAENVFLNVLEKQPKNTDIYEACFKFYLDTEQAMGIPELLADAEDSVVEKLSEYVVNEPQYSLDDSETYDDVQQLTLSSKEGTVRYTTDGSDPDMNSEVYKSPIQISEGSNVIKAIAVNDAGVPSQIAEKEYVVEFPIEDAPAVSPSTGQYESAQSIEIKVPDGYTAYYTTDGSDPDTSSKKYTEPIEMPQGETLFKAVLVTKSGRLSGITTRNYVRE